MTRFSRCPGMRNMATFGTLDEIRHGQIQIYFAYEFLKHDAVFDWCHKSSKTENWIIISLRHALDDIAHTRDATSSAIMLNWAWSSPLLIFSSLPCPPTQQNAATTHSQPCFKVFKPTKPATPRSVNQWS